MQPIVMPAVTAFSTFSTSISRSTVLAPTSRGRRPGGLTRPCAARLPDTARRLYHVHGEREANGERVGRRRGAAGGPAGSGSFFASGLLRAAGQRAASVG